MLCLLWSVSGFVISKGSLCTLPNRKLYTKVPGKLYPKVLRENKSPGAALALQASINHKGLIKSYIVGGDLQFKSLSLTLY
jgi:hypothetical protein